MIKEPRQKMADQMRELASLGLFYWATRRLSIQGEYFRPEIMKRR